MIWRGHMYNLVHRVKQHILGNEVIFFVWGTQENNLKEGRPLCGRTSPAQDNNTLDDNVQNAEVISQESKKQSLFGMYGNENKSRINSFRYVARILILV